MGFEEVIEEIGEDDEAEREAVMKLRQGRCGWRGGGRRAVPAEENGVDEVGEEEAGGDVGDVVPPSEACKRDDGVRRHRMIHPVLLHDIQTSQHRGIIIDSSEKNEGKIRSSESRNMRYDLLLPANP